MQWLILALIALYPCELSESDMAPPARPAPGGPARSYPGPQPRLANRGLSKVAKEKFLAQFELQAGRELVPCLHRSLGQAGAITFMARLHKKGNVSAVRVLSAHQGLDDCAARAIEKMKFEEAGAGLSDENVEVSWRFDF